MFFQRDGHFCFVKALKERLIQFDVAFFIRLMVTDVSEAKIEKYNLLRRERTEHFPF